MSKIDFGSVLTEIAVILFILVIIVFMVIRWTTLTSDSLGTESLYSRPTWTENGTEE